MITLQVVLIALLAGLSIFLASVEASYHLLKRRRLTAVGFHDEARIELAQRYLDDPPRMLLPVHLGTYTAHVGMTVIITSLAFRLVDHWAMLTAFGIMIAYLLLFRVSVPYILVRQAPEGTFLRLLPAFHIWAQALDPVVARLRRRAPRQQVLPLEPRRLLPQQRPRKRHRPDCPRPLRPGTPRRQGPPQDRP